MTTNSNSAIFNCTSARVMRASNAYLSIFTIHIHFLLTIQEYHIGCNKSINKSSILSHYRKSSNPIIRPPHGQHAAACTYGMGVLEPSTRWVYSIHVLDIYIRDIYCGARSRVYPWGGSRYGRRVATCGGPALWARRR